jgi:hypothetical protein
MSPPVLSKKRRGVGSPQRAALRPRGAGIVSIRSMVLKVQAQRLKSQKRIEATAL